MKKVISFSLFVFFTLFIIENALSWDNNVTHKDLSEYAAENSVLVNDLGVEFKWEKSKTVLEWIQDGAEREDEGSKLEAIIGTARFNNHFHNPLKQSWGQAGLDDWVGVLHYTGESSLLWAQDGTNQQNIVGGDWSWQSVEV